MPALPGDSLRMPLILPFLLLALSLPAIAIGIVWLRIRSKEKRRDAYLAEVRETLRASGAEPLGEGVFRRDGRYFKVEASTNPLFASGYSVRLAAWSDTIHEFEIHRGRPVPAEFASYKPLLQGWQSAGKMFTECYVAGVTSDPDLSDDARALLEIAKAPLAKSWAGGTFTYREGFEAKVPQWHWRHDQRPRLPKDVTRACFSYWREGPLLNPVLMKVLWELAGAGRKFFISDVKDLGFLERAYGGQGLAIRGSLVELNKPDLAVAADLHTDGEFFGGLLVAKEVPPGFETEDMPRTAFQDAATKALKQVDFYARRLFDDECSWYSGEIEVVSAAPLDVRAAVAKVAAELGAPLMDIDVRFRKRLVVPLDY